RIIYITAGSKGKLAERALGVDSADVEAGWGALFSGTEPPPNVATTLTRTHAIYDLSAGTGTAWAANIARLAPDAAMTHLAPRPPEEYARHATDFLVEQLAPRPAVRSAVEQILRWVADCGIGARRSPGNAVAIHPGSGSQAKNWPIGHFVELADVLRVRGRPVRFILGEVERERWPASDVAALSAAGEIVTPADYTALLDVIATAAAFVGNDSGPAHLAGIVGVPTVGIYLSHKVATWRPLGPRVTVLHGPALTDVTASSVAAAVG
ncbi:MAG TPA: glycosyltransferase family 9 protein, partial [Tepidisphaeraceae bacterium]|nr:glycosyltransferase family 9 protein [Tepidisphaeraceae bacterium]